MLKVTEYLAAALTAYSLHLVFFTRSVNAVVSAVTVHDVMRLPVSTFSMSIFALAIIARIIVSTTIEKQGLIDPDQWHHDHKVSGEYYRIASIRGSRVLYNLETYTERGTRWHIRANEREKNALALCLVGLLILLFAKCLEFNRVAERSTALIYGLAGMSVIWLGAWVWALAERGRWETVGPRPTPTTSMEDIYRQKAYGDAAVAGLSDANAALGGNKPKTKPQHPPYKN